MEPKSKKINQPKMLLIDDDEIFGGIMKKAAKNAGLDLNHCATLDIFSSLKSWDFDVILMDCHLGEFNGFELTSYIQEKMNKKVPVVMVSSDQQNSDNKWPSSIQKFVHKTKGPNAILEAALESSKNIKQKF